MKIGHCVLALMLVLWNGNSVAAKHAVSSQSSSVLCNKKVDLSITIDSSASTGEQNYQMYKEIAKGILSRFEISPRGVHVALSYFSNYHHIVAKFDKYRPLVELKSIVDDMALEKSISRLSSTIDEIHYGVFAGNGSGVRPKGSGTKLAAIFMTDGYSTAGYELTKERARTMHDYGVEMFVVHAKGNTYKKAITTIASKPKHNHIFEISSDPKEQSQMIDRLIKQICNGKYT